MTDDGRVRVRNVYPFSDHDRQMLAAISDRLEIVHEGEDDPGWVNSLDDPDVEILSASYAPADLRRTPRVWWLAQAGAGVDHLAGTDPSITVTNGSGVAAVAMAEYVLAAVLMVTERIPQRLANQAERSWESKRVELAGLRLRGRTAVIVGYGSIGREAARLLAACGVRIVAVKARPQQRADTGWSEPGTGDPEGTIPERFASIAELPAVLADADFLISTLPHTSATEGLIGAAAFAAAGRPITVINVGRGAVIDEDALLAALDEGRVSSAVLDVTTREPLPPGHPFWTHDRVFVSPHVSGIGDLDAMWHNAALVLAENLHRHLDGRALINVVDLARGY